MASTNLAALARELGRAMAEQRTFLRQQIHLKIKEHDLNITFELLEVMSFLNLHDGANQQEIADVMIKDKSSMTYLIDNLVKRDMVARREDEVDRRNKRVFLTGTGRALMNKLDPWLTDMYEKATNNIPAMDIEKAISLVHSMNKKLKESL
ncbi:DNA-binding transcriptional regulator, MarR family [Chitinophaga costaii]|uniref:DNA-binding transcriptional regulator, MarR family n=1 Tax=Chitinophaga costaii TaxID=1335309 RepID=A0A1C4DIP3_9BACT|nr:MarR family transcriptional regulator [Chitinophaga costaii]PUZ24648.1 MarR family transcriptional regulator [Chitinophaga costaii]SCC31100.1 DNA-binding transcriptional regulator, MarR family [Chitinophaga costaii]